MVSQVLTIYTTPVVYLYLDRLRLWNERRHAQRRQKRLSSGRHPAAGPVADSGAPRAPQA